MIFGITKIIKSVLFLIYFLLVSFSVQAGVVLNIAIANPSEYSSEVIPVLHSLPLGVQKSDVLDASGLEVKYNEAEDIYYLQGEFDLGPKETKNLRIRLRDVWRIEQDKVERLSRMLDSRIESIQEEEEGEIAELIGADLRRKLSDILTQQEEAAGSIERRMKLYSVNREKIRQIEDKIFSLRSLVGVYREGQDVDLGVVTLFIEVENIMDREAVLPIEYYLPAEVIPEYIVDQDDFSIEYDPNRGRFFLEKIANFNPNEVKRYSLEVKNVWHIRVALLNQYLIEAGDIRERLTGSRAEDMAEELLRIIEEEINAIIYSQEGAETVSERIAVYKLNQQRHEKIKENLNRLRLLMVEFPEEEIDTAREAIDQAMERLEALSRVDMSEFAERLAERLRQIGVWRIVYTILLFLIALTVFFYGLWFFRLRKEEQRRFEKK